MAKAKPKKKIGRPVFKIDRDEFLSICSIPNLTKAEICGHFGCSMATLSRWCHREFGEPFESFKPKKELETRRKIFEAQMDLIAKRNATMCIWLGKQYLGQTDKQEIDQKTEHSGEVSVICYPSNGREVEKG